MSIEPHLTLLDLVLLPAGEWLPDGGCWTVARLAEGIGYCLHGGLAEDLRAGEVVVTSPGPAAQVTLRASQLGELRLEYFRVMPELLNGLLTTVESHQLERIARQAEPRVLRHAAGSPVALKFARLAALPARDSLVIRSAFLQLWAASVAEVLRLPTADGDSKKNLETAFHRFLGKLSEQELAATTLADMAAQLHCSERHLSRLFRLEFGMSLREKQTEWSLQRACQMLADPDIKIKTVAYDTGYRHVGFFNVVFKKRFGLTPKAWRQQNLSGRKDRRASDTPPLLRGRRTGELTARNHGPTGPE